MSPPPQTFLQRNATVAGVAVALVTSLGTLVWTFGASRADQATLAIRVEKLEAQIPEMARLQTSIAVLQVQIGDVQRRAMSIEDKMDRLLIAPMPNFGR